MIISDLKKGFSSFFEKYISKTYLGKLYSIIESNYNTIAVNQPFNEYDFSNDAIRLQFLISTSSQGLLLFNNNKITRLFNEKGFYGITFYKSYFYCFCKTGRFGKVISFRIKDGFAINVQNRIHGLSKGIHQIDFIDDDLYVINTYNNSILIYKNIASKKNIFWSEFDEQIFPNGELKYGRESSNYNHFNSLYKFNEDLLVVAHNETYKTRKKSEIFQLDINSYKTKNISEIDGSSCHNIFKDDIREIICKSLESTLTINNKDYFISNDILTRGLAITNKYILVGGSDFAFKRELRNHTNGYVYIFNNSMDLIESIKINNTQIHELLIISEVDKSIINFAGNL